MRPVVINEHVTIGTREAKTDNMIDDFLRMINRMIGPWYSSERLLENVFDFANSF